MPARLRDIIRALASLGIEVRPPSGGGSHWRAGGPQGKSYRIPAHNGDRSEIGDEYIRGLCREFGLDLKELKRRL